MRQFSFRNLQEPVQRPWLWTLAVFAFLVVWNRSRLWDPPYWDAIMGVYTQGIWLSRHHFDYLTLLEMPHFPVGGPNIQYFGFQAALFAILIRLLSPAVCFWILHHLILLCSAVTTVLAFRMLRQECSRRDALLWTLVAASHPIWTGQSISLYVEIPLALGIVGSLWMIQQRRYRAGAGICFLSFFAKNSALLFALACWAWSLALMLLSRWRRTTESSSAPAWPLMIPFPLMAALSTVDPTIFKSISNLPDQMLHFFWKSTFQFPVLLLQLTILIGLLAVKGLRRIQGQSAGDGHRLDFPLLLALLIVGFWLSYIIHVCPLPRYATMVIFPMALLMGIGLRDRPAWAGLLAVPMIAFNLVSQEGRGMPPIPVQRGVRTGAELERSREYLQDLDDIRAICAEMEKTFFSAPVVTKWPFTHMLRVPEFGFVSRPLPYVVEGAQPALINNTPPLVWYLNQPGAHKTLCIYSPTMNEVAWGTSLKPGSGDKIVVQSQTRRAPIVVFWRDWDKRGMP